MIPAWQPAAALSDPGITVDEAAILDAGRRVIRLEASSIAALESRIDDSFASAVRILYAATQPGDRVEVPEKKVTF
jgi:hypothetical protein